MADEKYLTFFDGTKMPILGYGTWRVNSFFFLNILQSNKIVSNDL